MRLVLLLFTKPYPGYSFTTWCFLLIDEIRKMLQDKDKTITGFNVGFNDGIDAGQTIFHCHIHVIPRRKNDIPDPIGG